MSGRGSRPIALSPRPMADQRADGVLLADGLVRGGGGARAALQQRLEIGLADHLLGLGRLQLQHIARQRLDLVGPGDMAPFRPHQRDIVLLVLDGALELRSAVLEPARLELHVVDQDDEPGQKAERQKTQETHHRENPEDEFATHLALTRFGE